MQTISTSSPNQAIAEDLLNSKSTPALRKAVARISKMPEAEDIFSRALHLEELCNDSEAVKSILREALDSVAKPAAVTKSSTYKLTPADKETVSWMVNAGQDDTERNVRNLTGTPRCIAVLEKAIATEKAGANRSSRLKIMESRLRAFTKSAKPLPLAGESRLPDWSRARAYLEGAKTFTRLAIAGRILLGYELHLLKVELGFAGQGRRPKEKAHDAPFKSLNRTWDQWCKAELGFGHDTANRAIETYEAAKSRLKRLGGQPHLLALLETSPAKLDEEARKVLAGLVDGLDWGDSLTDLMAEFRIFKKRQEIEGGNTSKGTKDKKGKAEAAEQLAFAFFSKVPATVVKLEKGVSGLMLSPDYKAYLHQLPITATAPNEVGLEDLAATLEAAIKGDLTRMLADVKEAIAAKLQSAAHTPPALVS